MQVFQIIAAELRKLLKPLSSPLYFLAYDCAVQSKWSARLSFQDDSSFFFVVQLNLVVCVCVSLSPTFEEMHMEDVYSAFNEN